MKTFEVLQYSEGVGPLQPHTQGTTRVSMFDGTVRTHRKEREGWQEVQTSSETERLLWGALSHLQGVQREEISPSNKYKLRLSNPIHFETTEVWFRKNDVEEWVEIPYDAVPLEERCQILAQCALALKREGHNL